MQPLIPTQLHLTGEQRARLRGLAVDDGRSLSELVREAIDAYLDERAAPPAAAREAPFSSLPVPTSGAWERA